MKGSQHGRSVAFHSPSWLPMFVQPLFGGMRGSLPLSWHRLTADHPVAGRGSQHRPDSLRLGAGCRGGTVSGHGLSEAEPCG